MECPFCRSNQLMVVNSRPTQKDTQVWRRRKCLDCKGIFTTYEKMDLSHLIVIKKSGKAEKYQRAKLYSGIYHSSIDKKNVDRGEMSKLSEDITNQVEQEILQLKKKNIMSKEITTIVLDLLATKEPDIFLRFLAYREGGNAKEINRAIGKYFK